MIYRLDVIYGQDTPAPTGYTKISVDLNKGCGGDYIYLCYSTSATTEAPITSIQVFAADSPDFTIQSGYVKINKDLNKGAGGKYIYACYARDTRYPPLAEVAVIQGPNRLVYPSSSEWVRVNQDCSGGQREAEMVKPGDGLPNERAR